MVWETGRGRRRETERRGRSGEKGEATLKSELISKYHCVTSDAFHLFLFPFFSFGLELISSSHYPGVFAHFPTSEISLLVSDSSSVSAPPLSQELSHQSKSANAASST